MVSVIDQTVRAGARVGKRVKIFKMRRRGGERLTVHHQMADRYGCAAELRETQTWLRRHNREQVECWPQTSICGFFVCFFMGLQLLLKYDKLKQICIANGLDLSNNNNYYVYCLILIQILHHMPIKY